MVLVSETTDQKSNDKQYEQELSKVRKDKEELEKHLHSLKGKNEGEKLVIENLNQELQKSISRINELEQAQAQIKFLEKELSNTKRESEEYRQKQTVTVSDKKQNPALGRKFVLRFLLFLFAVVLYGFYSKIFLLNLIPQEKLLLQILNKRIP